MAAGAETLEAAPELAAMLAVSRLVAAGGPLEALLDRVAAEAAGVVGAGSASILLLEGRVSFRLAGSFGLSPTYAALLDRAPALAPGHGPSGLATQRGVPVAIADTEQRRAVRALALGRAYRGLSGDGLGPADLRPRDDRRAERLPPPARPVAGARTGAAAASSPSTRRARSPPRS